MKVSLSMRRAGRRGRMIGNGCRLAIPRGKEIAPPKMEGAPCTIFQFRLALRQWRQRRRMSSISSRRGLSTPPLSFVENAGQPSPRAIVSRLGKGLIAAAHRNVLLLADGYAPDSRTSMG